MKLIGGVAQLVERGTQNPASMVRFHFPPQIFYGAQANQVEALD